MKANEKKEEVESKELLTYQEMLEQLDPERSHLLLGNGFNLNLGVMTTYEEIYKRMCKLHNLYDKVKEIAKSNQYNLEVLVEILQEQISMDGKDSIFLKEYLNSKFKSDFMKATIRIVNNRLNSLYKAQEENLYLFFNKFQNYFTLNFDPLLYLLLMMFKKNKNVMVLKKKTTTSELFENNDEEVQTFEQECIKFAYEVYNKYQYQIVDTTQENEVAFRISMGKKNSTSFISETQQMLINKLNDENRKFNEDELKRHIKQAYKEIKDSKYTVVSNDGFLNDEYLQDEGNSNLSILQNVFFIHGAFHIYIDKKNKKIKKILQKSDISMHKNIEEIIESEDRDIICVLKPDDKIDDINKNKYLKRCFAKLSEIEGDIVILGSSIADNDNHIFNALKNNEKIETVYISTSKKELVGTKQNASKAFSNIKVVKYFDYNTIGFQNPKVLTDNS